MGREAGGLGDHCASKSFGVGREEIESAADFFNISDKVLERKEPQIKSGTELIN